jgi:uncharacterized protein DUF4832/glycosyl hydrolase family 42 (putative beta-galactosidase)
MRLTTRIISGCLLALILTAGALGQKLILRPVEIDDLLINPGMGIETFQRFNGNAINPGKRWSEVGPTERLAQADPKPDYPASTVAYCRWYWWQLEPEPGQYRWEILDLAIEQAMEQGQQMGIRLMPYDGKDALPEWYRNSGARRANKPSDKDGKIWSPDADDPLYLKHWGGLVKAFAERYDGHPGIHFVDISTLGYWGEGWGPYLPDWQVQKALLDLYLDGFKRTHLLTNFDELQALTYGVSQGTGWRVDCWGDMKARYWESWGKKWSHMLDFYPLQLVRAEAQEAWERYPVSLETCGTPLYWKEQDYDIDYIMEQALRWHVSSVNIKSTAIPEEWKDEFEELQKKMGYRFILRRLELPEVIEAGKMFPVSMWWLNKGVAPVYYDYELAMEFQSAASSARIPTAAPVRSWLPGDAVYDDTLYAPESLAPGKYRVRIALLDPSTDKPAIRLAIEGRQDDGWYDLGEVEVR